MTSEHLIGRVVVITGAASGFGRLIAQKCAFGGARVMAVDIDAGGLATVVDGIRAAGGAADSYVADVTDMAAMQSAVGRTVEEFGAVDVLVNNAGVMPLAYFADHEKAWRRWHQAIDINIKGVVNGITAVYDQMIAQGRGHVVNISSIYGNGGIAGAGVYSATKVAVAAISDALRVEAQGAIKVSTVRPTGVLGTNLATGVVNPTAVTELAGQNAAQFAENLGNYFTGTLKAEKTDVDSVQYWVITPDELADAVVGVIDQPWGINISDITVRASGENYIR